MTDTTQAAHSVFTATSAFSLAAVAGIAIVATTAARKLLPKNAPWQDRCTFIWLTFDALIHFIFEGSFIALSTFGRTVDTSSGIFAELWREYAAADSRWAIADPTIVSLELLTVFGAGPLSAYIAYQIVKGDPTRYYWIIVLNVAELYGGWMTFCPEWLTGSPALNTSNALYLWVYLVFMNVIWVVIPVWLMFDAYKHIAGSLRIVQANKQRKVE